VKSAKSSVYSAVTRLCIFFIASCWRVWCTHVLVHLQKKRIDWCDHQPLVIHSCFVLKAAQS